MKPAFLVIHLTMALESAVRHCESDYLEPETHKGLVH